MRYLCITKKRKVRTNIEIKTNKASLFMMKVGLIDKGVRLNLGRIAYICPVMRIKSRITFDDKLIVVRWEISPL